MTADSKGTYRGVYTYGLERISVRDEVSVEGKPNNPLYYLYDGNGEDYDIESNLQYLRARYYDPEIGRFISEDSYLGEIMQPLSLNRYAYTANNPLMYQDPSGHSVVKFGSRGQSVKELQQLLISSGYNGLKVDGVFGEGTLSAVKAYQTSKGLTVDGIVGSQTWEALRGSSNPTLRKGSRGGAVTKLQQGLMRLDYDLGPYGADGVFGDKTKQAVKDFQGKNGLTKDGVVGKQTWAALAAKKVISNNRNNCGGSNTGMGNNNKPVGNVAYVFYLPEWKNEAKDDRKRLAAYYGLKEAQVILTPVTSADELTKAWNGMGTVDGKKVNISAVVIDTHASAGSLGFGNGNSMSTNDISNLDEKNVRKLILYGCNAGHLDHKDDNPAAEFAKKVNGAPVLASDGTVKNGTPRKLGFFGAYEYKSVNDKAFQGQRPNGSTRDNQGWIIYKSIDGKTTTSDSIGKKLTLSQMLEKKK